MYVSGTHTHITYNIFFSFVFILISLSRKKLKIFRKSLAQMEMKEISFIHSANVNEKEISWLCTQQPKVVHFSKTKWRQSFIPFIMNCYRILTLRGRHMKNEYDNDNDYYNTHNSFEAHFREMKEKKNRIIIMKASIINACRGWAGEKKEKIKFIFAYTK